MRDPHGYRLLAFLFAIPAGIVLAALVAGNWVREMSRYVTPWKETP